MASLYRKRAVCPKNPKKHKRFVATAHVTQDWIVDETGMFLALFNDVSAVEVTHDVNEDDEWMCHECGAKAEFKEIDE